MTRREFLRHLSTAAIAIPSASAILAACGNPPKSPESQATAALANPSHPVELPIFDEIQPIADGLAPEKNASLQIFNWADYISPKVVKGFCEKFNCDYDYSTFNNMAEAEQKMLGGQIADVFWPSAEVLGRLVRAKLLQPLNHSYIPNIGNLWPVFSNPGPWYDPGWRYTVPYELFSTGVGYRRDVATDEEASSQGWDLVWNPQFKGQIGVLDVYRETIGSALMKVGFAGPDTTSQTWINKALTALKELVPLGVRIDIGYFANFAEKYQVHQGWGTDFVSYTRFYMPKGLSPDVVGFWHPEVGKGVVANDQMVIPANAPHPVLAHEFLNYMLDTQTATLNFVEYGYPAPMDELSGPRLVDRGLVAPQLQDAIMTPEEWEKGYWITELPPAAEQMYTQAWQEFSLATG